MRVPSTACRAKSTSSTSIAEVHRAPEQLAHQRTFGLIEAPERVVIGPLKAGQPQQSDALRTGALQLTAAAHSCHESVEPACKQMLGPVAGQALYRRFQLEASAGRSSSATNSATKRAG